MALMVGNIVSALFLPLVEVVLNFDGGGKPTGIMARVDSTSVHPQSFVP